MKAMLALSMVASSLVSTLVTLVITGVVSARPAEAQTSPEVVTAQRFVVQDADGRIRAQLGVDADSSTRLALFDRDGARRNHIGVDANGNPALILQDVDGTFRIALAVNVNPGVAVLSLREPGLGGERFQPSRIQLAVNGDGETHMSVFEPPGNTPVWVAP